MRADRFVFLHGFTQTHHHWTDVAHRLAGHLGSQPRLAGVDLPGHGLAADDLDGTIDTIGPRLAALAGPGTYVGYSMGGRIALVAAAGGHPHLERLVLIGATPGIEDDDERSERARLDRERATRVEAIGVEAFLDEWLRMPMFARLPADPRGLAHRRSNTIAGLAHSLRDYGTGAQTPLWDALPAIRIPVLVLAGALDTKFAAIGERMASLLPDARFETVPDAGHAAHTEQPDDVVESIGRWLRAQPSASPTASSRP